MGSEVVERDLELVEGDMTNALATIEQADIVERVVIAGDLSKLQPADRVAYYRATCESLGLNPLTKPFEYITLNGKLTLYARKDATDQLRNAHRISIVSLERERIDDVYIVTARARTMDGRTDESTGAVNVQGLKGDALANALMKAETKAKRRVTLSICGLGWMDESEVDSTPAIRVQVDQATGEIVDAQPTPAPRKPARPLVARLRDLVNQARAQGVALPALGKPADMTDEQLHDAAREIEARIAARAGDVLPTLDEEFDAIEANRQNASGN